MKENEINAILRDDINKALETDRTGASVSQEWLAEQIGISKVTLSQFKNGGTLSKDNRQKIVKYFGREIVLSARRNRNS